MWGHVGVVRWLLDKGAATDLRDRYFLTALWASSHHDRFSVVKLLLERGVDPCVVAGHRYSLHLMRATSRSCALLSYPSAKANINHCDNGGRTALWEACERGRWRVVRALLESGADPTIAPTIPHLSGITPMAVAKGRHRECVVA
jgi:ankyrin repeat protein